MSAFRFLYNAARIHYSLISMGKNFVWKKSRCVFLRAEKTRPRERNASCNKGRTWTLRKMSSTARLSTTHAQVRLMHFGKFDLRRFEFDNSDGEKNYTPITGWKSLDKCNSLRYLRYILRILEVNVKRKNWRQPDKG